MKDITKEDAKKILDRWAAEAVHPREFCDAMWRLIELDRLRMIHDESKGYCFINAMTKEELKRLPRSSTIKCDCGEAVIIVVGMRFYLNPGARPKFRNNESYAEVVGFGRTPGCIRVLFEGNKTPDSFAISHFHDSSGHRQWEATVQR